MNRFINFFIISIFKLIFHSFRQSELKKPTKDNGPVSVTDKNQNFGELCVCRIIMNLMKD